MCLLRVLQLFLVTTIVAATLQVPRESCRDHYLHGESETKVLPLAQKGSSIYHVECIVPSPYSDNVIMNVRNGLEKWHTLKGEKQTVDYQISDRDYLRTLMAGAFCQQTIFIKWAIPGDKEIVSDTLTVVSLSGVARDINVNFTMNDLSHEYSLIDADSAILHVHPSQYSLPHSIRLSPLTCRQKVVTNTSCEFELNTRNQFVGINNKDYKEVSFAFRTDVQSTPLVELDSGNGTYKLELSEGYLIKGDGYPAPVGLLADGYWHTVRIDLVSRIIFIDEPNSLIIGNQWKFKVRRIRVVVSGRVTAFKLNGKPDWVCGEPLENRSKPEILRQICPPGKSICHCKAPQAALRQACPPSPADTYTLTAAPSFFFKEHMQMRSFSVSIKSEADAGLIAYGQQIGSDSRVERFQVQFDGEVLTAFSCLLIDHKCRSCHIVRPGGFHIDEWIRVSFFYDAQYAFVTANKQICQLKPNGTQYGFVDLYNGPQSHNPRSFIFIGGALDENAYSYRGRMDTVFINQFFDKTTAKAPSLKGCIGDLYIDRDLIPLAALYDQQLKDRLRNTPLKMEPGCSSCPSSKCSARCLGYSKQNDPICDCSNSFMAKLPATGQCIVERKAMEPTALSLGFAEPMVLRDLLRRDSQHFHAPIKVWALLRFPEVSDNDRIIFSVSGLRVTVGDYGHRVVIDASQIGLREEFYVESTDERLHLLSVEWKKTPFGNNITFTVRIDHDIRNVYLTRHPFMIPTDVTVSLFNSSSNQEAFAGCLSEFTIDYDTLDAPDSVDVLTRLFGKVDPYLAASNSTPLLYDDQCGIRDPLLWSKPTSTFGRFHEYDPTGNSKALHGSDMQIVSLIVVSILILILLCVLVIYCCRRQHTRTYHTAERERLVQKSETSTSSPGHSASPATLASPKRTIITQTETATPRSIIMQNVRDGKPTNAPMASQEV